MHLPYYLARFVRYKAVMNIGPQSTRVQETRTPPVPPHTNAGRATQEGATELTADDESCISHGVDTH